MWLRRAFYGWLFPAAFLLPLWLFAGWVVFNAGGWALLWMLLLAIPSVFVGQLILTLLVRARGTVRAERAVSWWDVLGFTVWHGLTISLGFYDEGWWASAFVVTIFAAVGLFWLELWQLWREAQPSRIVLRTRENVAYIPPQRPQQEATEPSEVFVLKERPPAS
jgi:hypothetical protein